MFRHHSVAARVRRGILVTAGLTAAALVTSLAAALSPPSQPAQAGVTGVAAVKYVFLTFDDGPHSVYTPQVLDILTRYSARATFFQVGRNVKAYPWLTKRAYARGNSVQNHTWSHPDLRYVSWTTFKYQVQTTDSYIRAQTGYTPRCLRPPYGGVNSTVYSRAAALGKKIRLWTVDPRDWSRPGTSVIVSRVLNNVQSGSIVLLHDAGGDRSQTVAALPTILRTLKSRGYEFRRLWCS
ncbi:MAG TPA: polysaccharide deacetylase family protein [Micromonosporaceae bacterium]